MLKCANCGREIDRLDNYIKMQEFKEENMIAELFFHKACWEDKLKPRKLMGSLLQRTFKLLDKAEEKLE